MSSHTEHDFETAIEAGLTNSGGYETWNPAAYNEALALFPTDVTDFLKESQPVKWQALEALLGPKTAATILDSLSKELDLKGTLNKVGVEATIAAHLSIDTRPAPCIHFKARFGFGSSGKFGPSYKSALAAQQISARERG